MYNKDDLRWLVVGTSDLSTGKPTSSTNSTLIHSLVGSDHLVAACLHTLALDAHRCGVRTTGRPVNYLQGHIRYDLLILIHLNIAHFLNDISVLI